MFETMDMTVLMVVVLALGAAGFFAGLAMDGVLQDDSFGVVGNMVILIVGALIGVHFGSTVRLPLDALTADAVRGVIGAFICLTALAMIKNMLNRFGF